MAGQQQAPAQNQQLPIRGSGKAPSWGWKGPEDSITLPVFFDEVERTCESVGQQTDWQYIQAAILYADPTAADLWRRLSQANQPTKRQQHGMRSKRNAMGSTRNPMRPADTRLLI